MAFIGSALHSALSKDITAPHFLHFKNTSSAPIIPCVAYTLPPQNGHGSNLLLIFVPPFQYLYIQYIEIPAECQYIQQHFIIFFEIFLQCLAFFKKINKIIIISPSTLRKTLCCPPLRGNVCYKKIKNQCGDNTFIKVKNVIQPLFPTVSRFLITVFYTYFIKFSEHIVHRRILLFLA